MSIPTTPLTICFAAVTNLFPGPAMTSTRSNPLPPSLNPYAKAETACAPPTARNSSAPAIAAAASMASLALGLATTTRSHPAARAAIAVISTDEGSGYRPPGA